MCGNDLDSVLDAIFSEFDKPGSPGCAVGVVKDGELIYAKGHGYANLEQETPISPKTVFHCASMSKQFTAMSVALLEEQGLIKAEDDIHLYLPELPDYGAAVTVANLIHMTNGLHDIYSLAGYILGIREDDYFTREEAWEMVKACDWLMFTPGERWSYGNTGYFLLGQIVERVIGVTLSEFADMSIFRPLGMSRTLFRDDRAMLIKGRAESYSDYAYVHYNDDRPSYCSRGQTYAINADLMSLPGAGGMWTTLEDLHKWDQNFYKNRLGRGDEALIRKVTRRGRLNDGSFAPYGYGLFLREKAGFKYVFHGGSAYGWSSAIYRIPKERFTVICLGNHTSLYDRIEVYPESYGLLDKVAEFVIPEYRVGGRTGSTAVVAGTTRPELAGTLPESASLLVGRYQNPDDSWLWSISLEDGRLEVEENYSDRFELEAQKDSTYRAGTGRISVDVIRDGGIVTGLEVTRGGKTAVYYRFLAGMGVEELAEYAGQYRCDRLNVGYGITVEQGGLMLRNHSRHHTGVDFIYRPSVRDTFLASAPPTVTWYCVTFRRDSKGEVSSFVFRDDEGSGREHFVFERQPFALGKGRTIPSKQLQGDTKKEQ